MMMAVAAVSAFLNLAVAAVAQVLLLHGVVESVYDPVVLALIAQLSVSTSVCQAR